MPALSADELQRRRPVWRALSDLFLDTETRFHLAGLASVLAQSGYDDDAARRIFEREVIPVCASNLFSYTGAWAGFELDERRLARHAERGPGASGVVLRWMVLPFVGRQLGAALALRGALMTHAEHERWPLVRAWQQLAYEYFDGLDSGAFGERLLRDAGVDRETLRNSWRTEVRPAFRAALAASERAKDEAWSARVESVIARL